MREAKILGFLGFFSLDRSAWAESHGEVAFFGAHHGANVVWLVVGSVTGRLAGRAADDLTGWVAIGSNHRRGELHSTHGEWVAVDVGDVVGDVTIVRGELELSHRSGGIGCELDGHTNSFGTVSLGISARRERGHVGVRALGNRGEIDLEAAVVDDVGSSSHGRRGHGEQHGCRGND